jgi:hypothetical protein
MMSEETVTNPTDQEVSGSDRPRRSNREVEQVFAEMFEGESQEQPMQEESEIGEVQSSGEHEEVGQEEAEASADVYEDVAEESEEQPEGHSEFYRVIVDGKEEDVALDELISGYQRTSDYTKKTTALADQRKEFEGFQQDLQSEREHYANVLAQFQQQVEEAGKSNIDWERLERENPLEWLHMKQLDRDREEQLSAVRSEQEKTQQLLEGQQSEELQKLLESERSLMLQKIPEWANGDIQAEDQRKLKEYGKLRGYSDEDLNEIYDHRAVQVMLDGMKYIDLTQGQKVTNAKNISKIKTANPGNRETAKRTSTRNQQALRANLKTSGKVDDAAALFATLMDG